MECLVCQNKDHEEDPMELNKERGYMVMFARLSDQLGSSILDGLTPGDVTVWQSSQDTVAVVKPG